MAKLDLTQYGITGSTVIAHNPSYEYLFEEETKAGLEGFDKGVNTELNAVNVMTGIYTGRSPKDKYIVKDAQSEDKVWWTSEEYKNDNHPMSEEVWKTVKEIAIKELCNKDLYVVDAFCGANEATRLRVRFIVEVAWQAHFVKNMFIQPTAEELESFEPNFVIYNASKAKVENYKELGLNSETCVAFNTTSREQCIINTWYGGEMKKGMFSMMNYYLPLHLYKKEGNCIFSTPIIYFFVFIFLKAMFLRHKTLSSLGSSFRAFSKSEWAFLYSPLFI